MSQNPSKRASPWDGHTSRRAWLTRRSTSCGRRCASSPKMMRRGACFKRLCHNEQPIAGDVLKRLAYTARPNDLQAPHELFAPQSEMDHFIARARDRKSTRLNSSHVSTSYAVFCLKKNTISYSQRLRTTRASARAFITFGHYST